MSIWSILWHDTTAPFLAGHNFLSAIKGTSFSKMAEGGFNADDHLPSADEQNLAVRTNDSLAPVMIKQIRDLSIEPGQDIMIDNQLRKQVCIVGIIRRVSESGVAIIYEVDDGTGTISVQDYNLDETAEPLPINTYVYVVGRIMPKDLNSITAFGVKPVTDPNQIAYHTLQALFVHQFSLHGLPPGSAYATAERNQSSGASQPKSEPSRQVNMDDEIDKAIIDLLKGKRDGAHKKEIIAELGQKFPVEKISVGIERLELNCAVFQTGEDVFSTF